MNSKKLKKVDSYIHVTGHTVPEKLGSERGKTHQSSNMSSSNQPNKSSSEDPTSKSEQQQYDDIHSSTGGQGGRKLTPLPLTNPNAKPGQNQVKFEYIFFLKL